ncbi:MAG: hypothetical protein O3B13_23740 [Planctomycetota bacterium]|nr:hypothetical protein [Planctomycetota bacterium]
MSQLIGVVAVGEIDDPPVSQGVTTTLHEGSSGMTLKQIRSPGGKLVTFLSLFVDGFGRGGRAGFVECRCHFFLTQL